MLIFRILLLLTNQVKQLLDMVQSKQKFCWHIIVLLEDSFACIKYFARCIEKYYSLPHTKMAQQLVLTLKGYISFFQSCCSVFQILIFDITRYCISCNVSFAALNAVGKTLGSVIGRFRMTKVAFKEPTNMGLGHTKKSFPQSFITFCRSDI